MKKYEILTKDWSNMQSFGAHFIKCEQSSGEQILTNAYKPIF